MTVYFADGEIERNTECAVTFDDQVLTVSYDDIGGVVAYRGDDLGHGHFHLKRLRRSDGSSYNADDWASLNRAPAAKFLEGYWEEEGRKGMWRISLESSRIS